MKNAARPVSVNLLIAALSVLCLLTAGSALAQSLSIEPITWNVIGLDSNSPLSGPYRFPIGARVCNTGASTAFNVQATFTWDSANSYVNLRPGTAGSGTPGAPAGLPVPPTVIDLPSTNPDTCTDFYFEGEVTRDSAAYNTTRRYHITATANGGLSVATATPRELYVEHLISQSRNSVTDMQLSTTGAVGPYTSVPAGGTMTLMVGNEYWIKLVGSTATNGYEQIETFINFPNTIFQVLSVDTTYTAESSSNMNPPYDRLYGDGCVWESNPQSPNYRSCLSTGKAGGNITVTYKVKVLSVPSSPLVNPEALTSLIYDFSGSSYHYNADYSAQTRYVRISDPTTLGISKKFWPNPISLDGVSSLTFTITNPYETAIGDANFADIFPKTSSNPSAPGNMTLADGTTSNTCGGTLEGRTAGGSYHAPATGDVGVRLTGGVLPANRSCTITVNVTTTATGSYNNTTPVSGELSGNLYVGTVDTTRYPSDTLTVVSTPAAPPAPSTCVNPVQLALWDFQGGTTGSTSTASDITTSQTFYSAFGGVNSVATSTDGGTLAWGATGPNASPPTASWVETVASSNNYFEFTLTGTGRYNGLYVQFDANPERNGDWANPRSNVFVKSSADGGAFTAYTLSPTPTYPQADKGVWTTGLLATAATTGSSSTTFRFSVDSGSKITSRLNLDNVRFMGCRRPDPPTVVKSFSPNPVAVGSNSTLTITITNPNAALQTMYGVAISDYLPQEAMQGAVAVTNSSPTVTGTGTAFKTQLVAGSVISIPSTPVNLPSTVTATNGSRTVTTSGGFTGNLVAGSTIVIDLVNYTVATVDSDLQVTLARAYRGTSGGGKTGAAYKNYTVSSVDSDTRLTLTSNYAGSTASGISISSGLTLTGTPTTTCGSTVYGAAGYRAISLSGGDLSGTLAFANGSTSVTGTGTAFTSELGAGSILYVPFRLTGTVSVTNGSKVVAGAGTLFTTQLAVGKIVSINSVDYVVAGITNNTTLALSMAYSGSTASGLTARSFREYTVQSVGGPLSLTLSTAYSSAADLSGLTIKAGLAGGSTTCSITAPVKASLAGVRTNVSNTVTSTESGDNLTASGFATANLTALLPPTITKAFAPGTIPSSGTSTLTFTITNPNPNHTISSVAFSDTYPANVTNTNPVSPSTTCTSGSVTAAAGGSSVGLSGASIGGGGSCTVTTTVTSSTATGNLTGTLSVTNGSTTVNTTANLTSEVVAGDVIYVLGTGSKLTAVTSTTLTLATPYTGATASGLTVPKGYFNNYSGSVAGHSTTVNNGIVSHVVNGSTVYGNTPSDTLMVRTSNPSLSLMKQVSTSDSGPWRDSMIIPTGSRVYYRFTVENTGDAALSSIAVNDPDVSTSSCTWTNPLPVANAAGTEVTSCIVGVSTPILAVAGSKKNIARAQGTATTTVYSNYDSAVYQNGNFGHVPSGYLYMNLYNDGGAFHLNGDGVGDTRFGSTITDNATDGINTPTYTPKVTDDGVTYTPGYSWTSPPSGTGTGSVDMTVMCPSTCYVNAWIDWNKDNDFSDSGEQVFTNLMVGNGLNRQQFSIPGGLTLDGTYYTRFRVYNDLPTNPQPNGQAFAGSTPLEGEIEDPFFTITGGVVTPVTLSYFRSERRGLGVRFDWSTATESGNVGFNLFAEEDGRRTLVNPELVPSQAVDALDRQDYSFTADVKGSTFYVEDVSILGETRLHGPFELGQEYGALVEESKVDHEAVRREHAAKTAARQDDLKRSLRVPPEALEPGKPGGASFLLGRSLNLKVRQTGIYRVTYEALRDAGLDLAGVPTPKIALANRGQLVPIYVGGGFSGSAKFGPGSFIEFHGEALDTIYTDTNVYTLQVIQGAAPRIPENSGAPPAGQVPPTSYLERLHVNNQRAFAEYAPGTDAWYDTWMLVYRTLMSWSFPFEVDQLATPASDSTLELVVWGVTDWDASPDHHLLVNVNGIRAGDETFDGLVEKRMQITLPAGTLREGANTLQLTLPGDSGVAYEVQNLDRFDLGYRRQFLARDGRLIFTEAAKAFRVGNLPSKDVVVYRLASSGPERLRGARVEAAGGSYTVTFAGSLRKATYVVTAASALLAPEFEATRLDADLEKPAQLLIICHPDFLDDIEPLVSARRAQGFSVSVVDVNDILAQYGYGIFDPAAIKTYVAHAVERLGVEYVLLAGGDTYDYRNYLGRNSVSFIPSLYATTSPTVKFVPVDPQYADVNGDNVPDVAIGRFPARTSDEMALMVRKTFAYADKSYGFTSVFASDQNDGIVSYKSITNDLIAAMPPGWSVQALHLDDMPVAQARTQLLAAMNRGSAMVTFAGHSSAVAWTFSNLFSTKHAAALTNTGRPFVVVQWGCWNTYAVDPVNNNLVQAFLFSGDKGAAAVLGASTLTDSRSEELLGALLTPRLATPGMTMGRALQEAKAELAATRPDLADVLLGWTLMGDPTLPVEP